MRVLSRPVLATPIRFLLGLILLGFAHAYAQTNYTTNVTLLHLLAAGGPVPYANVCFTPADQYGNGISVSAPTWGLVEPNPPMCQTVATGALTGALHVPDAAHTNAPQAIFYNISIQQQNSLGMPVGPPVQFTAVPNVTGTTFSLDTYTPAISLPIPPSQAIATGTNVPASCTAPSLFISNTGAIYACAGGVYVLSVGAGSGSSSASVPVTTNLLAGDGAGNAANSNISPSAITSAANAAAAAQTAATAAQSVASAAQSAAAAAQSAAATAIPGSKAIGGGNSIPTTDTVGWVPGDVACAANTSGKLNDCGTVAAALGTNPVPYALAVASPQMTAGLSYWIKWMEGTGTTSADVTANGHPATISGSGAAYAWQPAVGIALNGYTATIPNVAGYPTHGLCAYYPAGYASGQIGIFSTYGYIGSANVVSGGNTYPGFSVNGAYGPSVGHGYDTYYPAIGALGGSASVISQTGFSGNHCIEYIFGASGSPGHIVVDGLEVQYSSTPAAQTFSQTAAQLTNFITLASAETNGLFPQPPVIYSNWGSSSLDTVAQGVTRTSLELARLSALGVSFGNPPPNQTSSNVCSFEGTSIDQGFMAGSVPTSQQLSLDFPCSLYDYSISGQTDADMYFAFPTRSAVVRSPRASRNIAWNGGPTNGLINDGETQQQALGNAIGWSREAHAAGYKSIFTCMLSRSGNGVTGEAGFTADQIAQTFNAALLAYGDEADWLACPAATPALGATGASANTTYFADGTHPTTTGAAFYIADERCAFEGVYPQPITNIGANYTQKCSDRLIADSASAATTITLIDANYASFNKAGKLCFANTGTGSITVSPVNSETINGLTSLTVAAGSTACIQPNLANLSTGGANWIRTQ